MEIITALGRILPRWIEPFLSASLVLLTVFGVGRWSWNEYFVSINQDPNYLSLTHANDVSISRAVYDENKIKPVYLISYRHPGSHNPAAPLMDDWEFSMEGLNRDVPIYRMWWPGRGPNNKGLLSMLVEGQAKYGDKRDTLIVLPPMYFYLKTLLTTTLGGHVVKEIPVVESPQGRSRGGSGIIPADKILAILVRLPYMGKDLLHRVSERNTLPVIFEELIPPIDLATKQELLAMGSFSAESKEIIERYIIAPKNWKVGKSAAFNLVDPYFWTLREWVPGGITQPFRMRCEWNLEVEEEGEYQFGLNASVYTSVVVDDRPAVSFWLSDKGLKEAQLGIYGKSIRLDKGIHKINVEQLMLNFNQSIMYQFRLLWQRPDGRREVLPIERLGPPD